MNGMSDRVPLSEAFDALYHVPRSQVYAGSRGRQSGNIHLHVKRGEAFRAGRIRRIERQSLCGRRGWYERPVEADTGTCSRCIEIGTRDNGRLFDLIAAGAAATPETRWETCPFCSCPGEQFDGHVCEDFAATPETSSE